MNELHSISEPFDLLKGAFQSIPSSQAHTLLIGLACAISLQRYPCVEDSIDRVTQTITQLVGVYGPARKDFERQLSSWLSQLLEDGYYPEALELYTLYQKSSPHTTARLPIKIPKSVPEEWARFFAKTI